MAETASAPTQKLGSALFDWTKLEVKPTQAGERRDIVDAPTATMKNFECHVTTLNPGEAPHEAHRHPDEEFIIVKEGVVEVVINDRTQHAGPGSMLFFASNDLHGLRNAGNTRATYYVFRVLTSDTPKTSAP